IIRIMRLAWLLLLLSCAPCLAEVRGVVYEDANGNGVRDAGESGIEGIKLSNGRVLVRSAADGSYAIATGPGDIVFAVKPAGRGFGRRPDGLPASWQAGDAGDRFDVGLSAVQDAAGP